VRLRSYGSFPYWLLAICACTDFAAFVIIFTVTRRLAESQSPSWWMGVLGTTLSLASATASLGGGLLSRRLDSRIIFLAGVCSLLAGIVLCGVLLPSGSELAAGYMLLGLGLGGLYPPLMGWLNRGGSQPASSASSGVTLRLVLFCVAWNLGIMAGQLTGGWLFARGATVAVVVAAAAGIVNLLLAIVVVDRVSKEPPETLGPVEAVVDHRPVALFQRLSWMANVGGMFGAAMVVHLIADLAVAIQISSKTQGILMACWRAVTIVTYLAMYRLTFWQFRLAPQVISSGLGAIGLLVIAKADSEVGLCFGLVLLGQLVGFNYFSGLFYSSAGPSVKQRTLAAGLHEATLAVGMAVGTLAGGWLATQYGYRVPYQLAAVGIVLFLLLQVAVAVRQRESI
jgi:MFS family permease